MNLHRLRADLAALLRRDRQRAPQALVQCTHRYPSGTSAWSACKDKGGGVWLTRCALFGLTVKC